MTNLIWLVVDHIKVDHQDHHYDYNGHHDCCHYHYHHGHHDCHYNHDKPDLTCSRSHKNWPVHEWLQAFATLAGCHHHLLNQFEITYFAGDLYSWCWWWLEFEIIYPIQGDHCSMMIRVTTMLMIRMIVMINCGRPVQNLVMVMIMVMIMEIWWWRSKRWSR